MIISFSRSFVYLKTRKTAGSSIEIALRSICGDQDILTPLKKEERLIAARGPQNNLFPVGEWPLTERVKWWLGNHKVNDRPACGYPCHAPAHMVHKRFPQEFSRFLRIGNVRNPYDRQVSLYFWRMRKMEKKLSFEDWMLSKPAPILNNMEIISLDGNSVLDFVLRYERLAEDLEQLSIKLGVNPLPLMVAKGGHRDERHYRDFYTSKTQKLVEEWYSPEFKLFPYEF